MGFGLEEAVPDHSAGAAGGGRAVAEFYRLDGCLDAVEGFSCGGPGGCELAALVLARKEPLAVNVCAAEAVPFVVVNGLSVPLTVIVGRPDGAAAQGLG